MQLNMQSTAFTICSKINDVTLIIDDYLKFTIMMSSGQYDANI